MERVSKNQYYLTIARAVAMRGTCLRRNYGAVIVKNDQIVATGYNGAPRGTRNCCDIGSCIRQESNIPSGERYELCRAVHAEQNAIISAGYDKTNGATLYLSGYDVEKGMNIPAPDCCTMCKRVVMNAGISMVIFDNSPFDMRVQYVKDWAEQL